MPPRRQITTCPDCKSQELQIQEIQAPLVFQYEQNKSGIIVFQGASTLVGAERMVYATCLNCGKMGRIRNITGINDLVYSVTDSKSRKAKKR